MYVAQPETDENGDTFEVWLVRRSYALLAPVCKMGALVLLPLLLIADPTFYFWNLWPDAVPHSYLVAFHAAAFLFLGVMWLITRASKTPRPGSQLPKTHQQRKWALATFIVVGLMLFVWFGVVSWLGFGDISVVAVANLLIAAVFPYPGRLRRWSYLAQAGLVSAGIIVLDASGRFLGQLQFVNVLVILTVSVVIDEYMMRNARSLFLQKCDVARARQRADDVLFNALPHDIAQELKEHNQVQPQTHAQMTVLFADIVGFTALAAQLSAGQVINLLNRLFLLFDAQVDIAGVEKIKTMGDAYMVVHTSDAAAVARFALALPACVLRVNEEFGLNLAIRIGMHLGPTIAGVIGTRRFLYDVWGDAVNVASRMESTGIAGKIHVTEAVRQALFGNFATEYRGMLEIAGKGPMHTYFLLGSQGEVLP